MYLAIIREDMKDPSMTTFLEKVQSITNTIQAQIAFTRVYQDIGSQEPQWHDLEAGIRKLEIPGAVTMDVNVKGIEIFSDPMFEKVFFALLDNSIRHGDHVTQITVSSIESEKDLKVIWEDNGIGIQPGEKGNIFKRGVGKNTGLGLFLVSEILALTGIAIRENGEPGRGARFEMLVPKGAWRRAGTATQ
jgi:signal transduction histidine kinase